MESAAGRFGDESRVNKQSLGRVASDARPQGTRRSAT